MAKLVVLSFDEKEEDMFNAVLSVFDTCDKVSSISKRSINTRLIFERMEIDLSKRTVIKANKEIKLTFTEFEIVQLLAQNPGKVFSKEQIYDIVWKEPYSGDYNIVMSHIRNIREKIEDNPGNPVYIQTVWGVGYRFNQNISSGL